MRKKDKEIQDRKVIDRIIGRASLCRLALCDGDQPYIVTMNFGYDGSRLYFHCATEGRKIDLIKKNNKVCFQMDLNYELVEAEKPCKYTSKFLSVVGFGKAALLTDRDEKIPALDIIMKHYDGPSGDYVDEVLEKVTVIRVDIESISGKYSGYDLNTI